MSRAIPDFPDASSYQGGWDVDRFFRDSPDPAHQLVAEKATEGTTYVNPDFARVVERAHARKQGVIAYHFAGGGDAKAEADFFFETCVKHGALKAGLDFLAVLDVERGVGSAEANRAWVGTWIRRFSYRMKLHGILWRRRRPGLYAGSFWRQFVAGGPFGCRWWWAAYVSEGSWRLYVPVAFLSAFNLCFAWQYTAQGNDPGFAHPHDRSHFIGGRRKFRRLRLLPKP